VRATAVLRDRVAGMRQKLAMIADGRLDGRALHALVALQEEAVRRAGSATALSPLATSDAEDALVDWLDGEGVAAGWELAPVLVAGGLDAAWLARVRVAVGSDCLATALRWIAYTVETELLMGEIDDAVTRISTLVGTAKQYSQLDRAPHQVVDVHELLDATLAMLQGVGRRRQRGVSAPTPGWGRWRREMSGPVTAWPAAAGRMSGRSLGGVGVRFARARRPPAGGTWPGAARL
jgi:hypothetical protein